MTTEKTRLFSQKDLRNLVFPLMAEQFLSVFVGMADTIMVTSAGEAAVSGVALVDNINMLIIMMFSALCTGGAVVASQLLGAKNHKRAQDTVSQLLMVSVLFSTTITVVLLIFRVPVLRGLFGDIEADVMQASLTYLTISALSFPFLAIYNSCTALVRSMNRARVTLTASLVLNVINLIGNAICVYGFGMGVEGVAYPTLVSRMLIALAMTRVLYSKELPVHLTRGIKWKLDFKLIKNILHIGIPSALENGFFQFGRLVLVSLIAAFGTVHIAANGVANGIDSIGCVPGMGVNLAMIAVVGRCVGARDYEQATYYAKQLLKMAYLYGGIVNGVIFLGLPWILSWYNLSPETLALSYQLVSIHVLCGIVLWPPSFCIANVLRAANDVKYSLWVAVAAFVSFRLIGSIVFGKWMQLGVLGVWIAMVFDWIMRTVLYTWRFKNKKWQKHKIVTD